MTTRTLTYKRAIDRSHQMIRGLIIALSIVCPLFVFSQEVWPETDVVRKAIETYPTLRTATLEIEKMKALQKTAFNPQQPQFTIETPADVGIGFEVDQEFDFPTVYTSRSTWLRSKTALAAESAKLTRRELIKKVRIAYLEAQLAQARFDYVTRQDSLWQVISQQSQRLFEAGEINRADLVLAKQRSGTAILSTQQALTEVNNQLAALSVYVNTNVERVEAITTIEGNPDTTGTYFFEPYVAQQANVIENEMKVLRAARGPGVILGYLRVPDFDTEYRYRYKLGLTVPIFQSQYTGEIRASKYERMQLDAEREQQFKEAALAVLQWQHIIDQTAASLTWYEQTGLRQQAELIDINMRLFEAGEIDYALALRNIADAAQLQHQYFETVEMYNRAMIEMDYLKGASDE